MQQVKDTARATVRIGYDGRVHKSFRGPLAEERFANETKILSYLATRGCPFVPRLLESDAEALRIVTSNCGARVTQLDENRMLELYEELETFGVRHGDPFLRNVTYSQQLARFCLIDFEFATILETGEGLVQSAASGVDPDRDC
ncbi:MAG: serine/threonine protein phosphatase [Verrucomicrobiota bacterium]